MGEAFYWALNMSITAAFTGVVVYLVGRIPRVPRRVAAALWAVPFLRLTIPFGVTAPWSLMGVLGQFARKVTFGKIAIVNLNLTGYNCVKTAVSYGPFLLPSDDLAVLFALLELTWHAVSVILLLFAAIAWARTMHDARRALPLHGRVYLTDRVGSPITCGIFRPRILLPRPLPEETERFVLLHEEAHIRRHDNLFRLLAVALCCIHWYSPVNWWMLRRLLAAMEEAADEAVLNRCGEEERKAYARVLVEQAAGTAVCGSPLGGGALKSRIVRILSYRRMTALSLGLWILFGLLLASSLTTNGV